MSRRFPGGFRLAARPLRVGAVLGALVLCGAQTDVLTGEPVRPRSADPRPEPTIRNAPHAPLQAPRDTRDDPPIDVLVAPQQPYGAYGAYGPRQGVRR